MSEYALKNIIPTKSEASGLIYKNSLYFASHTNIFFFDKNKLSLFASVEGTIRSFAIINKNALICTENKIFMTYQDLIVGSLNRKVSAVDANDFLFAIGVNNCLEVWHIPKEYRFTLFKMHSKMVGHQAPINFIKFINKTTIITASDDCSVRIFDISSKKSRLISFISGKPTGLFILNENEGAVTTYRGSMIRFALKDHSSKAEILKLEKNILASAASSDLIAIISEKIEKIPSQEEENPFHFIYTQTNQIEAKKKIENNVKRYLEVYKHHEVIYTAEIDVVPKQICIENGKIAMLAENFVGIFNIQSNKFEMKIDLPKILNFNCEDGIIAAVCDDKSTKIYNGLTCIAQLWDEKSKGDLFSAEISKNTCCSVTKSGYISVFNISDQHCYRSFFAGEDTTDNLSFDFSCMSDDACLLFLANKKTISVLDLQKSKLIDSITIDAPLVNLKIFKDDLYYIDLNNQLTKHNIFSGIGKVIEIEKQVTNFSIKNKIIVVSTSTEICFYGLELNYMSSVRITLEGRHREEIYSKNKPVSSLDLNSSIVVCGGITNTIKLLKHSSNIKTLYKNCIYQKLKVSKNKEWENYKEKLMKEKNSEFNKKNFIECRKIVAEENKFYILSREGIGIYEKDNNRFNPIEFGIELNKDFVLKNLKEKNYVKSLISAIQLDEYDLIKNVLDEIDNVKFVFSYIPKSASEALVDYVVDYLKAEPTNMKYYETLKWMIYFHHQDKEGLLETIKEETQDYYKNLKENYFMLQCLSLKEAAYENEKEK